MSVSRGLRHPGSGNASTPDAAKFTPATSLEVRWYGSADDWTPAVGRVACQHSGFIADVGWSLGVTTTGQIEFTWSPTGAAAANIVKTATLTPAVLDRTPRGMGARLVLATGDVTFKHSPDGLTWIDFETNTTAPATSVFNSTQALVVGGGGSATWVGYTRWFELRVDGSIVADPAFEEEDAGVTAFDDTRGNRWTVTASAAIEAHTSFAPTAIQILDCDGVHRRADSFRFELCDRDLRPIGDLHPDRVGSVPTIDNDTSNATSRRLRGFRLLPDEAADVDVNRDRLRVYMVLQNGAEYRLGTFLWGDASYPKRSWGDQHDGDLTDFTYILNQQTTQVHGWSRGADIAYMYRITLSRAAFSQEQLAASLDQGPYGHLAEPKTWQPGATWYQILVDLGNLNGLAPPWFDRDGFLHLDPVPDPDVATPTVPPYGDAGRVVADTIVGSNDTVSAPNDFAVFDSGTDRIRVGRYQIPASAPHSFANRGYRVGLVESVQGTQWQAQVDFGAKRLARTKGDAFEWMTFESTLDPRHDTYDVLETRFDDVNKRWLETAWTFECRSAGKMRHTMKRVSFEL